MEGLVTKWDASTWTGTIESDGKSYIVKRQNMKRGTVLKVGDAVRFIPVNLFEGPTAQNVQPITQKSQQ
jgi:hypothetical protein